MIGSLPKSPATAVYWRASAISPSYRSTEHAARRYSAEAIPRYATRHPAHMGRTAAMAGNGARQNSSRVYRGSSSQPPIQSGVAMGNPQYVATDDNRTAAPDLSPAAACRIYRRSAVGFSTGLAIFRPDFSLEAGRSAPQGASEDFTRGCGTSYRYRTEGKAQVAQG